MDISKLLGKFSERILQLGTQIVDPETIIAQARGEKPMTP